MNRLTLYIDDRPATGDQRPMTDLSCRKFRMAISQRRVIRSIGVGPVRYMTISVHRVNQFGTSVQNNFGTCQGPIRYIKVYDFGTLTGHNMYRFSTSTSVHCRAYTYIERIMMMMFTSTNTWIPSVLNWSMRSAFDVASKNYNNDDNNKVSIVVFFHVRQTATQLRRLMN